MVVYRSIDIIILLNSGISVERYIGLLNGGISVERYYCPLEWWDIGRVMFLSS